MFAAEGEGSVECGAVGGLWLLVVLGLFLVREITPWQESGEFNLAAAAADPKELARQIRALNGWWYMLQQERDAALTDYATWDHADDQQHEDATLLLRASGAGIMQLAEDLDALYHVGLVRNV